MQFFRRGTHTLAAAGKLPFIGTLCFVRGIVGVILFAAFLHGTAIADIGRLLQVVTASAVVISAMLTAVMLLAEFAPTETTVLCLVGAEILPQAVVEMQAVIPLMTVPGDKSPTLPHLSGYGRGRSADHPSDDVKRVSENKPFLDHGSLGHSQMLCHNASFPPDSPVSILTAKEVFVNLIATVVKVTV